MHLRLELGLQFLLDGRHIHRLDHGLKLGHHRRRMHLPWYRLFRGKDVLTSRSQAPVAALRRYLCTAFYAHIRSDPGPRRWCSS